MKFDFSSLIGPAPLDVRAVVIVPCARCTPMRERAGLPIRLFGHVSMSEVLGIDDGGKSPVIRSTCEWCYRAIGPFNPGFLETVSETRRDQYLTNFRRAAAAG